MRCGKKSGMNTGKRLLSSNPPLGQASSVPNNIASTLLSGAANNFFPNIHQLLNILAVLPVTTCEVERSISSLRRLKTYVRSTMTEERLAGLALMHIHSDLPVDVEQILESFVIAHPHRMRLANITGLALMHIHSDLPVDVKQILESFVIAHPHRMRLANILQD